MNLTNPALIPTAATSEDVRKAAAATSFVAPASRAVATAALSPCNKLPQSQNTPMSV